MKKLFDRMTYSLLHEAPVALGLPSMHTSYCRVCGFHGRRGRPWKLAQGLVEGWEIDRRWKRMIERREGLRCSECGSVSRFRYLARVIMEELAPPALDYGSFYDYAGSADFRRLRVAEVNGCGALHRFLALNPDLAYSEYGSEDPAIPSEDLTRLSYPDAEFDLVLTSDTLEHVPDLSKALLEIERILKPGGKHIFTVPVVWDGRQTRQRALPDGDRIIHVHPPSYHGVWDARSPDRLVFREFGNDALDYLRTPGTDTTVRQHPDNPSMSVFVAVKAGGPTG